MSASTSGSLAVAGTVPAAAMGMTYLSMANSIGLAMGNAVASQQRGQVIGQATLVLVLAMVIIKGVSGK
ncbi:MAG: RebB family R body protein [Solimonas sp.]